MLGHFETFVQIKTLYKGPLKLHNLKLIKVQAIRFSEYYDPDDIDAIMDSYGSSDIHNLLLEESPPLNSTEIDAGEAKIYV